MLSPRFIPPELVIIAAGIGAALHIGKLPPALPELAQTLDLDLLASSFLLSMIMLAGLTLGLFMGATADTLGPRRALLAGLLMLSLSSFLGGFAQSPLQLLSARAAEGLGFLLVVLPAPGLIRQWVSAKHLSRRLGWWTTYMGLGIGSTLLLGPRLARPHPKNTHQPRPLVGCHNVWFIRCSVDGYCWFSANVIYPSRLFNMATGRFHCQCCFN